MPVKLIATFRIHSSIFIVIFLSSKFEISSSEGSTSSVTPLDPCSSCSHLPSPVLQPNNTSVQKKCSDNKIAYSDLYGSLRENNTCRFKVTCNDPISITAHLTKDDRNGTYFLEVNGTSYGPVDQIYCYESDENSCPKCPPPMEPLQPEDDGIGKCHNYAITESSLTNVTRNSTCLLLLLCQDKNAYAVGHPSNMGDHDCTYLLGSIRFSCYRGAWITIVCDVDPCDANLYLMEIDQYYCIDRTHTVPTIIPEITTSGTNIGSDSKTKLILYTTIPISIVVLIFLLIIIFLYISYRRNGRNLSFFRNYMKILNYRRRNTAVPNDSWIINPDKLELDTKSLIGYGTFTEIYKGFLYGDIPIFKIMKELNLHLYSKTSNNVTEIAAKQTLNYATENDLVVFRKEIEAMKILGYHPNVLCMYGYCWNKIMPQIIFEYCDIGNMGTYVSNLDTDNIENYDSYVKEFTSFAWQICNGMCHVVSRGIVHRDLAAKNVLLTKDKVVKVSDFGLSIQASDSENSNVRNSNFYPNRWSAFETFDLESFSEKSDVWSLGVTIWEIFSFGKIPYKEIESVDLRNYLKNGNRMQKPELCENSLYSLILQCWDSEPKKRPTFENLKTEISNRLLQRTNYYGYINPNGIEPN